MKESSFRKTTRPVIGLMPVLDPRIKPDVARKMVEPFSLQEKLEKLGLEVIPSRKIVAVEEDAVAEAVRMRDKGACGTVYYTAWFLRANVIIGAIQHSGLPALLWAIPDFGTASMVGFGVSHGSLDEVGIPHSVVCGKWSDENRRRMLAWARACHARKIIASSRYGQIGGRCLSMLPADADANQWRWKFGLDVDHAEQWTLIHQAQAVGEKQAVALVKDWKKKFRAIHVSDEVLIRSARLYLAGQDLFSRNRWDFVGIKCQFELLDNYLAPCLPIALWNDDGYIVSCESDMNAAITMLALNRMSGQPVMFSDIQYLDEDQKFARFLNCGTAPTMLAGGMGKVALENCPQVQGTYDPKSGKYLCKGGACPHFILPPGEVTLARFGRKKGRYVLHVTTGESFAYPHDPKSLLGIGAVWPFAYVRIRQEIPRFVENLRAHHINIAFGNWEPELRELARMWDVEVL